MKKIIYLLALILAITMTFVSCNNHNYSVSSVEQKTKINIGGLNGPTGIALASLMQNSEDGNTKGEYNYVMMSSPDEMVSKVINGEVDIASVPTNLALTLYNKTKGNVQLLAINTLGTMSVVTKGEQINSISDLKGKTIYSSGQGSVVEYTVNYLLEKNGLDPKNDVKIEYLAEHIELATKILTSDKIVAIVPEPFTTQVTMKDENAKLALNLTNEWQKIENDITLSMGCLIVSKNFASQNSNGVNEFLKEYESSLNFANENPEQVSLLVQKYKIIESAKLTQKAIPNCNMKYIDGKEMKQSIAPFYEILFNANPTSVGGALPDENFYYSK